MSFILYMVFMAGVYAAFALLLYLSAIPPDQTPSLRDFLSGRWLR